MNSKIKQILEYLEKACTTGTQANRNGIISDEEYRIINEYIADLESQVKDMGGSELVSVQVTIGCPSGQTDWIQYGTGNRIINIEIPVSKMEWVVDNLTSVVTDMGCLDE